MAVIYLQVRRQGLGKPQLLHFTSFDGADNLVITDIYAASEQPITGVSANLLCARIKERDSLKTVNYLAKDKIIEYVLEIIKPGDLVITLGAGDIVKVSDELAERLQNKVQLSLKK